MVIDMNESQLKTVALLRAFLKGTSAVQFRPCSGDAERYALIASQWHRHRQCPLTRRQVRYKRWVVLLNELIQERLLGPVTRSICPHRRSQRRRPCRPTMASCIASLRYRTNQLSSSSAQSIDLA